ncbi:MAG: response regulator [Gallionella sp.]|jgi:FixJ family two-component response regulator
MKTLLLIDDDPSLLLLMTKQCEAAGYTVEPHSSAGALLGSWFTNPDKYAAIITDCEMPIHRGPVLAKALRRLGCITPIIMVSGHGDVFDRHQLDQWGITAYLPKPFDVPMIKALLDEVLV